MYVHTESSIKDPYQSPFVLYPTAPSLTNWPKEPNIPAAHRTVSGLVVSGFGLRVQRFVIAPHQHDPIPPYEYRKSNCNVAASGYRTWNISLVPNIQV